MNERTRIQNRLRWHLHELNPGATAVGNRYLPGVGISRVLFSLGGRGGLD